MAVLEHGVRYQVRHQVRLLLLALQFFTRVPIPSAVFNPDWQRHALRYFPLVGLLVGACSAVVYLLAAWVWPPLPALLLALAAGVLLTGALHEDGLADVCDGFGAGGDAARILAIMRDSQIGVFGALGIGLTLALKCATLLALPTAQGAAALLLAHPLSRLCCLPLVYALEYVRPQGKAKALAQRISVGECWIALATVLPVCCLAMIWLPWRGVLIGMLLAALACAWLARLFVRRIGGYSGDCLGAVQQISELMLYLGLLAAWPH